jgi:hypothetical protein
MSNPKPETPPANLLSDAPSLDAAADQAIPACGGDACEAVKALIVANEFLEREIDEKVSQGYLRSLRQSDK